MISVARGAAEREVTMASSHFRNSSRSCLWVDSHDTFFNPAPFCAVCSAASQEQWSSCSLYLSWILIGHLTIRPLMRACPCLACGVLEPHQPWCSCADLREVGCLSQWFCVYLFIFFFLSVVFGRQGDRQSSSIPCDSQYCARLEPHSDFHLGFP